MLSAPSLTSWFSVAFETQTDKGLITSGSKAWTGMIEAPCIWPVHIVFLSRHQQHVGLYPVPEKTIVIMQLS